MAQKISQNFINISSTTPPSSPPIKKINEQISAFATPADFKAFTENTSISIENHSMRIMNILATMFVSMPT
jgi:hypothetical protein